MRLSEAAEQRIETIKKRYPNPKSAIMSALYIAQEELGFVSKDAIGWVAERIGVPPVQVMEVATFYTMYYKKPVGKYHVQVCRTLSCALVGAKKLSEHLQKRLHLEPHEVSADGMWSYEEVECLGSCGTAPMCQINDRFFEKLTPERLEEILKLIEQERPDLSLSTIKDSLGEGLAQFPKSQILEGR